MEKRDIPEKLTAYIGEEAERRNYQLVDIRVKGRDSLLLEIVLDKEGGITLDECSDFNRNITSWIEECAVFDGAYALDVCSPGLDRKLKSDRDFLWAEGKEVVITTHEPVDGKKEIVGRLLESDDNRRVVIEKKDGSTIRIERAIIANAKLRVEVSKKAKFHGE